MRDWPAFHCVKKLLEKAVGSACDEPWDRFEPRRLIRFSSQAACGHKEDNIKFTDNLKTIYAREGKLHNFFDDQTPANLYRGRKTGLTVPFLQPTMIGWPTQTDWRPPDVLAQDAQGKSPQYVGGDPANLHRCRKIGFRCR